MKFSLALVAAAAATFVSAQGLSDLPSCATGCATKELVSTNCGLSDFKCICSNDKFLTNISSCVKGACSQSDLKSTIDTAVSLCKAAGADIPQSLINSLVGSATGASSSPTSTKGSASASASATSGTEQSPSATAGGAAATSSAGAASQFGVSGLALGAALAVFVL